MFDDVVHNNVSNISSLTSHASTLDANPIAVITWLLTVTPTLCSCPLIRSGRYRGTLCLLSAFKQIKLSMEGILRFDESTYNPKGGYTESQSGTPLEP